MVAIAERSYSVPGCWSNAVVGGGLGYRVAVRRPWSERGCTVNEIILSLMPLRPSC